MPDMPAMLQPNSTAYTFPPEWAPHEAVWLGWADSYDYLRRQTVQVEMIRVLAPHVTICILVSSELVQNQAEDTLRQVGIELARVRFVQHPISNFWIRDPGPRFLTNGLKLRIANFGWNSYGLPKEVQALVGKGLSLLALVSNDLAEMRELELVTTDVIAEGGALEVSSSVILTYRDVAKQRNPGVPLERIEQEYLRVYGKQKVVWLSRSPLSDRLRAGPKFENYFGWGANGHIDEYIRFVNDSTIVIAQVSREDAAADALSAQDRAILLENLEELRAATDVEGRPFTIETLPVPGLHHFRDTHCLSESDKNGYYAHAFYREFDVGDEIHWIPAVSYLNFFVTNGVVLVPKYDREPKKDEEARATFQRLFPDRQVVQINPLAINRYGGGMHCITQQQPRIP